MIVAFKACMFPNFSHLCILLLLPIIHQANGHKLQKRTAS